MRPGAGKNIPDFLIDRPKGTHRDLDQALVTKQIIKKLKASITSTINKVHNLINETKKISV